MKTTCALALTFGLLASSANAALIALSDSSFEVAFGGNQATAESGWFTFNGTNTGQAQAVTPGSFWGGGSGIANRDGANATWASSIGTTGEDGASIYQTVQLDAGVTYRFTVGITQSSSVDKSDGKYALVFFSNGFVGLPVAETTGVAVNQGHSFFDDFVEYTPTTTANYHVGVRNRGFVDGTGADNDASTIFFDNARLVAIPEPSSAALLGLAGLALILRRRK